MTEIEILAKQTESAFEWNNKLIDSVPIEKWDTLASGIESNISWQVGHQIVSIYYHTIMATVGHIPELIEKLNLRRYTKLCTFDTMAKNMVGKTDSKEIRKHLEFMQERSLGVIKSLSPKDLHQKVEPTKMPNPVARTKFEAIDWNIKHVMWHCGQIAVIKRIVDNPYDFGLKRV